MLLFASLLASLFVPWYFESATIDPKAYDMQFKDCRKTLLISWTTATCESSGCEALEVLLKAKACPNPTQTWSNACAQVLAQSEDPLNAIECPTITQVFNTSLALTITSCVCACVCVVWTLVRACVSGYKYRSCLLLSILAIGLICMSTAIALFAFRLPSAFFADRSATVGFDVQCFSGPCKEFSGNENAFISSVPVDTKWGPFGWIVGLVSCLLYIPVICIYSAVGSDESNMSYTHSLQQAYADVDSDIASHSQNPSPYFKYEQEPLEYSRRRASPGAAASTHRGVFSSSINPSHSMYGSHNMSHLDITTQNTSLQK